jgi:DNA-binding MarR family transcriptional regulator
MEIIGVWPFWPGEAGGAGVSMLAACPGPVCSLRPALALIAVRSRGRCRFLYRSRRSSGCAGRRASSAAPFHDKASMCLQDTLLSGTLKDVDEIAEAAARLRMVVRVLNRRAQGGTAQGTPTRSQQAVLAWLAERGAMTPSALAAAEGIRPQSLGELVDALTRRRWVSRRADPGDRRQVLVSLTAAGRKALDRGRRLRQTWLTEAISTRLDPDERRTLIAAIGLLERVVLDQTADSDLDGRSGVARTSFR